MAFMILFVCGVCCCCIVSTTYVLTHVTLEAMAHQRPSKFSRGDLPSVATRL